MRYAIISIKNKQYKVSEGEEILVDKSNLETPDIKVLFYSDEKGIVLGNPYIERIKINALVVDKEIKGKKVNVFKYKAKSRYRKRMGFRPLYTKLLIKSIKL